MVHTENSEHFPIQPWAPGSTITKIQLILSLACCRLTPRPGKLRTKMVIALMRVLMSRALICVAKAIFVAKATSKIQNHPIIKFYLILTRDIL